MTEINKDNFQEMVLENPKPVLVDFYAAWCHPCAMLAPIVEEMAADHPEMDFFRCNVDECLEISFKYRATNLPTLLLFKDGVPVKKAVGYREREEIEPYFCGNAK